MAKVSKQRIAGIFTAAVAQLALDGREVMHTSKEKFICKAICEADGVSWYDLPENRSEVCRAALKVIESRLEGKEHLEAWLISKGVSAWHMSESKMQIYRHKWLKMLIKEFSKKA